MMTLDVHITTCHRKNVKCRERVHENSNWNVKAWTHEERLEISKISVESIIKFCSIIPHKTNITLIDDGSDIPEAINWLESISKIIQVKRYPPRGSSAGINDHINDILNSKKIPDYIFHVEDDNLLFNPKRLDWLTIFDNISKKSNHKILTFRSGLPVEISDKGFKNAWGPIKNEIYNDINYLIFNMMGNAHHVMNFNDYIQLLPLSGNTGGCESYLNNSILNNGWTNIELQIPVHSFHSHMLEWPVESFRLNDWHKTGEGREYGIKNMNEWLKNKKIVRTSHFKNFPPNGEFFEDLTDYVF